MFPVEQLLADVQSPEEAYKLLKENVMKENKISSTMADDDYGR